MGTFQLATWAGVGQVELGCGASLMKKKVCVGQISIDNLGWCGPSGAGLRRLEEKKVCVGCKVSGSIPQRLSHFFFELLIVNICCLNY